MDNKETSAHACSSEVCVLFSQTASSITYSTAGILHSWAHCCSGSEGNLWEAIMVSLLNKVQILREMNLDQNVGAELTECTEIQFSSAFLFAQNPVHV